MYLVDIVKIFFLQYNDTLSSPHINELEEVDKIKGTKGDKRLKRLEL